MSVFPGPSNAVVYAQFVLQGRWRRMLIVAGGYGLLLGTLMWLSTIGRSHLSSQDMTMFLGILAGLQVANLLIFGSFRVERAVRGDVSSRMIESHRLMPAPPLGSIFGYLFGAPLQPMLLAIVNFALGAVCCVIGGLPMAPWMLVNGALYLFAVFVHAIVMQLSFIMPGGFVLLLFAGYLLVGAGVAGALEVVPSLHVLLFPMASRASVFAQMFNPTPMTASSPIAFGYGCAFAGQVIIAAVAVRVAVRRYLSSTVVGISAPLGLIVLATWAGLAVANFGLPGRYGYVSGLSYNDDRFVAQTVFSLTTTMLLAMLPLASAARTAHAPPSTGELSGRRSWARFSEVWTLIAAVAIMIVLLICFSSARNGRSLGVRGITAFIFLNFSFSMACLFSRGYLRRRRPWIIVTAWVLLTWMVPVAADAVYCNMTDNVGGTTSLTALSPPGALALLWSDSSVALQWGLIWQVILTLVAGGLLLFARRKVMRTGERDPSGFPVAGPG